MLHLNRMTGQAIHIGTEITVTVKEISTNEDGRQVVRLGIVAPRYMCVDREEVRIRREKRINEVCTNEKRKKD